MVGTTTQCPYCPSSESADSLEWIQCNACHVWYHSKCLQLDNVDLIDRFHCPKCIQAHGPSTYKEPLQQRKSNRSQARLNYADLNEGKSTGDEQIWGKLLSVKSFAKDKFKRYKASDVNMQLLRSTGLKEPFVIERNEPELDMKMPSSNLDVYDIARLVGGDDLPVEVIDVATQSELPGWTMGRWANYFHSKKRDRIRNVISLEISGSDLADQITRPKIVRELDWVDLMWPVHDHPEEFPKVQLYCLMGTKDSYTDFHIDFGGSSVFYHILSGRKTFYFIEPTSTNLKKYQKWSSSSEQSTTFLGDLVKQCFSVELQEGNTMIIPSGWIHAVYTPEDAIVIGGNFLHTFGVATQLQVHEIEQATEVPLKFQFPYYRRLNWYALAKFDTWLMDEKKRKEFSYDELVNMALLASFLKSELIKGDVPISEKGIITQHSRKTHQIPDSVSQPTVLADRVLNLVKQAIAESDTLSSPKASKPKKPSQKISIKLSQPRQQTAFEEENDDLDDEYEEDYFDKDDEEFEVEHDEEDIIPASHHTQERKKRSRQKSESRKMSKIADESSSDEDDMGTRKKSNTVKSISGLFSNRKRSSNTLMPKSTKQRLLDRISNSKKY
ncbi:hypothetical protein EDC96DRAFT_522711 [Choanephora cucurbitarum]|nr:hypothetical protein EDC96DRAFT_522711 [Choanephora cucurbitarum]